jgi:hypothetical protein
MEPPTIQHVCYEDFIRLASEGAGDLEGFRSAVDELVERMGSHQARPVLLDLRYAAIPPLSEAALVQALGELKRRGLGVENKLAIVVDRDDEARVDRALACERIGEQMGMRLRGFADYGAALDWLSERPEAPAEE